MGTAPESPPTTERHDPFERVSPRASMSSATGRPDGPCVLFAVRLLASFAHAMPGRVQDRLLSNDRSVTATAHVAPAESELSAVAQQQLLGGQSISAQDRREGRGIKGLEVAAAPPTEARSDGDRPGESPNN